MTVTQSNDFLEKESLGKLMRKYSIPCVISLLVATLYNIVDQIFIANADYLGAYGNAANTVIYPLTVVAIGLAMMIGDGCCTFVSISLGAKEEENARRGIGSSVVSLVTSGIVLMVIYLVFQEQILSLFGARVSEETFRLSKEYFFWISIGVPFYMFGQAMNPIVRSDGSPRFAMAALLAGAAVNIILDPIFIFVLRWGMTGAAIATVLGQIASAVMFAAYLFRMKAVKLDRDSFKVRFNIMKKIIPLGMASLLTHISIVLSIAAVLKMVEKYGALDPIFGQPEYSHIPTAVVGIVMKLYQVVISVAIGLATGCIPIAGYNIGAQRGDRVRQLMKLLLLAEAAVGLIASVIFMLFTRQFTYIFGAANEGQDYIDFSVKCIRCFLSMAVLSCVNKGVSIFEQSLGKTKTATALSALRDVVFGVSLPIILPIFIGLNGVLYFMPVADVVTFIVSMFVVAHTGKALLKNVAKADAAPAPVEEPVLADPSARGIITIGRSYGSGGRTVGKLVAEALGVPYYDSELLERAAADSGLSKEFLESIDEKAVKNGYTYTRMAPDQNGRVENVAVRAQREIIEKIAAGGACVIVGRRADQILKGKKDLFRVFVSAPTDARVERVAQRDSLSPHESAQKVKKVDKERAAYYNQYAGGVWGAAANYDLCVDTERLGIQGAADLIITAVRNLL